MKFRILSLPVALALAVPPVPTAAAGTENFPGTRPRPASRFMDKKCAEGKPYFVCMTAGANKFLRIYYGRVK